MPIDRPKDRPVGDRAHLEPVAQAAHRTRARVAAERQANPAAFPLPIGLAASHAHLAAVTGEGEVLDVERHQLRASKPARESDDQ